MRVTSVLHQLDREILASMWSLPQPVHPPKLECRQVVAREKTDKVRGTDDDRTVGKALHDRTVAADRDTSPVARERYDRGA